MAVVTELVNNAVEHGPGKPITVTLVQSGDSIHGEVADHGNPAAAAPRVQEPTASGGRGLSLVDQLTASWAVHEGSTDVWFDVPLD